MNIFAIHDIAINYVPSRTQWRCAMWTMGTPGALTFLAIVAVMVAAALMLLA
jgi:hypothetical protein